jgi:hypothetical protein
MNQGESFIPLVVDKTPRNSLRGPETPAKTGEPGSYGVHGLPCVVVPLSHCSTFAEILRPTTPGGQHPLQDRYLSVYNNEVSSGGRRLPPWARGPYQKGHLWYE